MHFIEQWFGISPDGGTGAFEAAIVMVVVATIGVVVFRIAQKRRRDQVEA